MRFRVRLQRFGNAVIAAALLLVGLPGFAQTIGEWHQPKYDEALVTMGADTLIGTYSGAGTSVVVFEYGVPFLDAELQDGSGGSTGERIFGTCDNITAPTGKTDWSGWKPGGADCKIAWVMCFASLDPPYAEARQPYCHNPGGWSADRVHHTTSVANGIATIAPDANIIAIQLDEERSDAFKFAVEWLLRPSSDTAWYLANGYTAEEAAYYNTNFGGQSPAEFWNVVATSGSIPGLGAPTSSDPPDNYLVGAFPQVCTFADNPAPQNGLTFDKYVGDFLTHHEINENSEPPREVWLRYFEHYEAYSTVLKDAGIMPIFASHNYLWRKNYGTEAEPNWLTFVTSDGVGFPGCLENAYAVSGIAPNFLDFQGANQTGVKARYVLTNSSPELTDWVAPGGASSFSTPIVAASVAVLKSANLDPDATISEVEGYLDQSSLQAPTDISCNKDSNYDIADFPTAEFRSPDKGAHPDLNCGCHTSPPLPVLELGAGIDAALPP